MRAIDNYTDKEREVLALKGMTAPRTASERPARQNVESIRGRTMRKPTIYEALVTKLGRQPTHEEIKADVKRILQSAIVSLAEKGKLRFQR